VCGGHVKQTREIKEGDRICQQYSDLRGLNSKFVFKAKKKRTTGTRDEEDKREK